MAREPEKLLTVSETTNRYDLSLWSIYNNIHTDPTYPVVNLGPKRNYRLFKGRLERWLLNRPTEAATRRRFVPDADEILEGVKQ